MYVSLKKGSYQLHTSLDKVKAHVSLKMGKHLVLRPRYGEGNLTEAINRLNEDIKKGLPYFDLSTFNYQSGAVFDSENGEIPTYICDVWNYSYGLDLAAIQANAMTYEDIYGKEEPK